MNSWNFLPACGEDKVRLHRQTGSRVFVVEPFENCSDAELLRHAIAGEEAAFVTLYDRLKGGIYRYSYYMTNSRSVAEEVVQEVFVLLLKEGGGYREGRGDVGAFAFGIARNFIRRIDRRERRYEPIPADDSEELGACLISDGEAVPGALIRNEVMAQVRAAIASLPDHYRQTVLLCDLCELSYEQAALRLQCAVGTIRSRLHRAHAMLVEKLKPLRSSEPEVREEGPEGCLI